MDPKRFRSSLLIGLIGLVAATFGCAKSSTPGQTGGSANGGTSASGGKGGSGGATGLGGAVGGQNSGGATSAGGGASSAGGGSSSIGGQAGGANGTATGGKATGGAVVSGGATSTATGGSSGSSGGALGGVVATGGQGTGGRSTGGAPSGGATTATGGQAGKATGGSTASGGTIGTGGSLGSGGSATGGAPGSGGAPGNADASISGYHPCPTDGTACKIMPFGDSITDGYNSDTPGGYRVELFRRAHSAGKNITFVGNGWNGPSTVDGVAFPPRHEGHSGWTIYPAGSRRGISECLQASPNCLSTGSVMPEYTPHIVLLMIGTNDAIDSYDLPNAPTRLGTLIDTIYSQLPNVLIVVAQPIPSRGDASKGDDTGLSARLKTYGDAIPAVVKARADAGKHILIVDMYTPFNANKAALIEDQWHPNLAGYVVLATQWYAVLQSLL